jgi:hypothetical protein
MWRALLFEKDKGMLQACEPGAGRRSGGLHLKHGS